MKKNLIMKKVILAIVCFLTFGCLMAGTFGAFNRPVHASLKEDGWIDRNTSESKLLSVSDELYTTLSGVAGWGEGLSYTPALKADGLKIHVRDNVSALTDSTLFGFSFVRNLSDYGPEKANSLNIVFKTLNNRLYVHFTKCHDVANLDNSIAYFYNEDGSKNINIGGTIQTNEYTCYVFNLIDTSNVNYVTAKFDLSFEIHYESETNNYSIITKSNNDNAVLMTGTVPAQEKAYVDATYIDGVSNNGVSYLSYYNVGDNDLTVEVKTETNVTAPIIPEPEEPDGPSELPPEEQPEEPAEQSAWDNLLNWVSNNVIWTCVIGAGVLLFIIALILLIKK